MLENLRIARNLSLTVEFYNGAKDFSCLFPLRGRDVLCGWLGENVIKGIPHSYAWLTDNFPAMASQLSERRTQKPVYVFVQCTDRFQSDGQTRCKATERIPAKLRCERPRNSEAWITNHTQHGMMWRMLTVACEVPWKRSCLLQGHKDGYLEELVSGSGFEFVASQIWNNIPRCLMPCPFGRKLVRRVLYVTPALRCNGP